MQTNVNSSNAKSPEQDVSDAVTKLVTRARAAQAIYAGFDQERVDEVVTAVAWTLLEPATNRRLAEQAVSDTGLGRVEDKVTKNHRKTLNALKGGNAVILAPSPKGQMVCDEVVNLMQGALRRVGAPEDLVQKLPTPASKAATGELMNQVDLVVVTGSQNNVRAASTSGTPAIGVGAGNVPSIVDETADLADAAIKITASKTFGNATSCSSENSLIVFSDVYEPMIDALQAKGARRLDAGEKERLREIMWVDGHLSGQVTAKSSDEILDLTGIERAGATPPTPTS